MLVVLPVSLIVTTLDIRGVFNYCRAGDISKFPFHVVKRTKRTNKLYPERLGRIRGLKSGNLRVLCALFCFSLEGIFGDNHSEWWCLFLFLDSGGSWLSVDAVPSFVSCCCCPYWKYSSSFATVVCPQITKYPSCFDIKPCSCLKHFFLRNMGHFRKLWLYQSVYVLTSLSCKQTTTALSIISLLSYKRKWSKLQPKVRQQDVERQNDKI